jgi:hypothetical protein
VGLIPENELSRDLGLLLDPTTGGPVVYESMETSVEGVFACGNVVHVNDLVDHVTWSGEVAGKHAVQYALHGVSQPQRRIFLKPGANVQYVVPQFISGEKPLTLYLRVKRPERRVMITVGNAFQAFRRIVKPPEIITLKVPIKAKIVKEEVEVSVERRN